MTPTLYQIKKAVKSGLVDLQSFKELSRRDAALLLERVFEKEPTQAQMALLKKLGLDPVNFRTRKEASRAISVILDKQRQEREKLFRENAIKERLEFIEEKEFKVGKKVSHNYYGMQNQIIASITRDGFIRLQGRHGSFSPYLFDLLE